MDDDLVTALHDAQHGDARGFATLWRGLHPAVLRYLRVLAGEHAEDAASETWLHVIRDLDRFTGDLPAFRGWLFRIARHRGIDERRRRARHPETPYVPDHPALPQTPTPDAATQALEHRDTAWALGIIATLPDDQAEAVMLRIVAGLDVATTAHVLGKRAGAVRVATMRGLRRLAAHPQVRDHRDARLEAPDQRDGHPEARDHRSQAPDQRDGRPENRDHRSAPHSAKREHHAARHPAEEV